MSDHKAIIRWALKGQDFSKGRYSREHTWSFDGGATVQASPSPSVVRPPYSNPAAVDPEEAFVAAIASCHMLWFLALAAKQKFCVDRYADAAVGMMGRNAAGKEFVSLVTLRPDVAFSGERVPSLEELHALHHRAHEECFIAISVRTEIRCEPILARP